MIAWHCECNQAIELYTQNSYNGKGIIYIIYNIYKKQIKNIYGIGQNLMNPLICELYINKAV